MEAWQWELIHLRKDAVVVLEETGVNPPLNNRAEVAPLLAQVQHKANHPIQANNTKAVAWHNPKATIARRSAPPMPAQHNAAVHRRFRARRKMPTAHTIARLPIA